MENPLEVSAIKDHAKRIAIHYAWIIITHNANKSTAQYKSDVVFFETLLFFMGKVLQPAFGDEYIEEFEQELNRLFRTNSFNISIRKPLSPTINFNSTKPLFYQKTCESNAPTNLRPYYYENNAVRSFNAMHKRSPLISVLFPSTAERNVKTPLLNCRHNNHGRRAMTASQNTRKALYKSMY